MFLYLSLGLGVVLLIFAGPIARWRIALWSRYFSAPQEPEKSLKTAVWMWRVIGVLLLLNALMRYWILKFSGIVAK